MSPSATFKQLAEAMADRIDLGWRTPGTWGRTPRWMFWHWHQPWRRAHHAPPQLGGGVDHWEYAGNDFWVRDLQPRR